MGFLSAVWVPLGLALAAGFCAGWWFTALSYEHRQQQRQERETAREVERRVREGLAAEVRAWRIRLGTICPRCATRDAYRRFARLVVEAADEERP